MWYFSCPPHNWGFEFGCVGSCGNVYPTTCQLLRGVWRYIASGGSVAVGNGFGFVVAFAESTNFLGARASVRCGVCVILCGCSCCCCPYVVVGLLKLLLLTRQSAEHGVVGPKTEWDALIPWSRFPSVHRPKKFFTPCSLSYFFFPTEHTGPYPQAQLYWAGWTMGWMADWTSPMIKLPA